MIEVKELVGMKKTDDSKSQEKSSLNGVLEFGLWLYVIGVVMFAFITLVEGWEFNLLAIILAPLALLFAVFVGFIILHFFCTAIHYFSK